MLHVREAGAFGGISVSASHGSLDWSALQFIGSGGRALRANEAAELTDLYHQGLYPRVSAPDMSELRADATSVIRHVEAVAAAVDVERIRARKFKVALDGRGPAAIAMPRLLEALGCHVVPVETGVRVPLSSDPKAAAGDRAALGALVRRERADIGITQDWDAAALAIVDEAGTPLGAEAAARAGVPALRRDVFLDDDPRPEEMRRRWEQAIAAAKERGAAVLICHSRREIELVDPHRVRTRPRLKGLGSLTFPSSEQVTNRCRKVAVLTDARRVFRDMLA
jgi:hypothetical protein